MDALKLKLKTLPFGTQIVECHVDKSFFNDTVHIEVRHADIDVTLVVKRLTETTYHLDITCRGTMVIPCDRCLDDMQHMVDANYGVSVKQEGTVLDDSNDALLQVPASWRELDASPLVRDTILLTLPLTHCHELPEQCNSDMLALLDNHAAEATTDDTASATDPRWAALAQLRDEEKKEL